MRACVRIKALYYFGYDHFVSMGMPSMASELPGFVELLKTFAIARAFNEFFFYWAHRTFHTKALCV